MRLFCCLLSWTMEQQSFSCLYMNDMVTLPVWGGGCGFFWFNFQGQFRSKFILNGLLLPPGTFRGFPLVCFAAWVSLHHHFHGRPQVTTPAQPLNVLLSACSPFSKLAMHLRTQHRDSRTMWHHHGGAAQPSNTNIILLGSDGAEEYCVIVLNPSIVDRKSLFLASWSTSRNMHFEIDFPWTNKNVTITAFKKGWWTYVIYCLHPKP